MIKKSRGGTEDKNVIRRALAIDGMTQSANKQQNRALLLSIPVYRYILRPTFWGVLLVFFPFFFFFFLIFLIHFFFLTDAGFLSFR